MEVKARITVMVGSQITFNGQITLTDSYLLAKNSPAGMHDLLSTVAHMYGQCNGYSTVQLCCVGGIWQNWKDYTDSAKPEAFAHLTIWTEGNEKTFTAKQYKRNRKLLG